MEFSVGTKFNYNSDTENFKSVSNIYTNTNTKDKYKSMSMNVDTEEYDLDVFEGLSQKEYDESVNAILKELKEKLAIYDEEIEALEKESKKVKELVRNIAIFKVI